MRGAPGSGKSTLIAKAAQEAVKKGFSIELFHCAFDPNSADMVVIPYLRTAVLDGSPPHLIEPRRPGDRVIDLMEFADKAVLEQQQAELAEKQQQFEDAVQAAVGEIAEAKRLHDQLETFYIEAMDFDELDAVRERMINKVLHLASAK